MKNLYIDIYTEEPCDPDLTVECERLEIRANAVLDWLEQQGMAITHTPDCTTCANRGRLNGLSQEYLCVSCIHDDRWKKDHYKATL